MKVGSLNVEPEVAKAYGRKLFQKYDIAKKGVLGPKQCYEVFSDYCYRILTINPCPTMQESNSMFEVLDHNKDQRVTQTDFQNLAAKYLCSSSFTPVVTTTTTTTTTRSNTYASPPKPVAVGSNTSIQPKTTSVTSFSSNVRITSSTYNTTESVKTVSNSNNNRQLTTRAQQQLDAARRLFKKFDSDKSGYITMDQIPFIIKESYQVLGTTFVITPDVVQSYIKAADTNNDGKISLEEFENMTIRGLKLAGIEIYK